MKETCKEHNVIIAHTDLSSSVAVCSVSSLIQSSVSVVNYGDFTWCINNILDECETKPIDTLIVLGFILREHHIKTLNTYHQNKKIKSVIHITHAHDDKAVGMLKDYPFIESIGHDKDNKFSVAVLANNRFSDKEGVFSSRLTYLSELASYWTMHDRETKWGSSQISISHVTLALNDIFTDFSRRSTGAVRAGRHLQLMSCLFGCIEDTIIRKLPILTGDGKEFEDLVYKVMYMTFERYVTCLRTSKTTSAQIDHIGMVLMSELSWCSNTQAMSLMVAAVIAATIIHEGSDNNELVDVIGTRIYIPKYKIDTSVLSHLIHTFNMVDVAAVIHTNHKVELRANKLCEGIDLGKVAEEFGGGGLKAAAGFSLLGNKRQIETIRMDIISVLTIQIMGHLESS